MSGFPQDPGSRVIGEVQMSTHCLVLFLASQLSAVSVFGASWLRNPFFALSGAGLTLPASHEHSFVTS